MADKKEIRTTVDFNTMVFGKVPPQAVDVEKSILGQCLMFRDSFDEIRDTMRPEYFYSDAHQRVFRAMEALSATSQPIDILTVTEQLKAQDALEMVGGTYAVQTLTNSVVGNHNLKFHCAIVKEHFLKREAIRICGEVLGLAYEDSVPSEEIYSLLEKSLTNVSVSHTHGDMVPLTDALVSAMRQVSEWNKMREDNPDGDLTGIPSGFPKIDTLTRGWQGGDLIVLAARPSVGKSAFALALTLAAAAVGKHVGLWSLEMKIVAMVLRILSSVSDIPLTTIKTGKLGQQGSMQLYNRGVQRIAGYPIYFDETTGLTIDKLSSKCRRMKKKKQLDLVVIDYLQLMTPDKSKNTNREQEVSQISRSLKSLAMELNVPIIALSQLSREIEKRNNPVPQLSDLRESGAIEQDADLVGFLWGATEGQILEDPSLVTRRYFRIAKQRDGMLGTVDLELQSHIQRFEQAMGAMGPGWRPVE